jgi:hypothetical protein
MRCVISSMIVVVCCFPHFFPLCHLPCVMITSHFLPVSGFIRMFSLIIHV